MMVIEVIKSWEEWHLLVKIEVTTVTTDVTRTDYRSDKCHDRGDSKLTIEVITVVTDVVCHGGKTNIWPGNHHQTSIWWDWPETCCSCRTRAVTVGSPADQTHPCTCQSCCRDIATLHSWKDESLTSSLSADLHMATYHQMESYAITRSSPA